MSVRPQEFASHPVGFAAAMARGLWRGIGKGAHDGDTLIAFADKGMFDYQMVALRLLGVNAPEIVGTTGDVFARAQAAQRRVDELTTGRPILFRTQMSRAGSERMSFDRYLADVWVFVSGAEYLLTQILLAEGLVDAQVYAP